MLVFSRRGSNDPKMLTDRQGQTMQTQIRMLLEEQLRGVSDQGLQCLRFLLQHIEASLQVNVSLVQFFA